MTFLEYQIDLISRALMDAESVSMYCGNWDLDDLYKIKHHFNVEAQDMEYYKFSHK